MGKGLLLSSVGLQIMKIIGSTLYATLYTFDPMEEDRTYIAAHRSTAIGDGAKGHSRI